MNSIILGGVEYLANTVIGWILWFVGWVADGISSLALVQASLPWVQNAKTDMKAVAWTILGFYVAYIALTRYILWNEGTADPDGSSLVKSILRAAIGLAPAKLTPAISLVGVLTISRFFRNRSV